MPQLQMSDTSDEQKKVELPLEAGGYFKQGGNFGGSRGHGRTQPSSIQRCLGAVKEAYNIPHILQKTLPARYATKSKVQRAPSRNHTHGEPDDVDDDDDDVDDVDDDDFNTLHKVFRLCTPRARPV